MQIRGWLGCNDLLYQWPVLAGCTAPQRICPQAAGAPNITQEDFPMKKYQALLFAMVMWLSLNTISYAQESRAVVLGRVTDAAGASVPGAKVTAHHLPARARAHHLPARAQALHLAREGAPRENL
jgi:hypothetical protein